MFIVNPNNIEFEFEAEKYGFRNGEISAGNVKKSYCADYGCIGSLFWYTCWLPIGCPFECNGIESCKNVVAQIDNNYEIKCEQERACLNAKFTVNKVTQNPYFIECNKERACDNAEFVINLDANNDIDIIFDGIYIIYMHLCLYLQ